MFSRLPPCPAVALTLVTVVVGLSRLPAQTRHVVPDAYADIQAAIDAASPGDIVLVRPRTSGTWSGFTLRKPLSILGWRDAQGITFSPRIGVVDAASAVRIELGAGQRAAIAGIDIVELPGSAGGLSPVDVRGGVVCIEDCRISGGRATDPLVPVAALRARDCTLHIVRSTLSGNVDGNGLRTFRSDVVAMNVLARGGRYATAVALLSSRLHANACTILGGDLGRQGQAAGTGVFVDAASRAWIADSEVRGGTGTLGGTAIVNLGSQPVAWARTRVLAGGGLVPGSVSVGPVDPNARLLGVFRPTAPLPDAEALRAGTRFSAIYRGAPQDPVVVLVAGEIGAARTVPSVEQPVLLPALWFVAHAGALDAQGEVTLRWVVPADPALLDREIRLFGFSGATLPIQAAAPTGGFFRR